MKKEQPLYLSFILKYSIQNFNINNREEVVNELLKLIHYSEFMQEYGTFYSS